ncbi:hypothetical protein QQS21_004390 [Conoideocrella luteorostrata]|uniref:Uncharacterized protein n=1 Tax=Conoideocrella luteorostrata TaxID=1105319 RepID=A0AAJ0CVM8_9HYPO|nr:hypothetical protein QQS21_004390 [Conoideocrella luteorostrata]
MSQLSAYSFTKSGTPLFDSDYKLGDMNPLRFMDQHDMLNRWFLHQDRSSKPIYFFIKPCSILTHDGFACLLRQLVQWLPEPPTEKRFVLAHPDFDIQNFLVSEGELQGIIDSDGSPQRRRPISASMADAVLASRHVSLPEVNGGRKGASQGRGNSPNDLVKYRQIYRRFAAWVSESSEEDKADVTSMSLIADNLCIAACDLACCGGILEKVLQEIRMAIEGEFDDEGGDLA